MRVGSDETWDKAEEALEAAIKNLDIHTESMKEMEPFMDQN